MCLFGGDNEIRTRGLLVANEALYQLSHIPKALDNYTFFFGVCQTFFHSLEKIFFVFVIFVVFFSLYTRKQIDKNKKSRYNIYIICCIIKNDVNVV